MSEKAALIQFADGRELLRFGECDGCNRPGLTPGACCTHILLPLSRAYSEDEQAWVRLHQGLDFFNPSTIKVETKCSALSVNGRCDLFGLPERPAMCERFPEMPENLQPGCAYSFTELKGMQPSQL